MFKGLRRKLHKDLMFIGVAIIIAGFIASGIIDKFNETAIQTHAIITAIDAGENVETGEEGGKKLFGGKDRIDIVYNIDGKEYENKLGYYDDELVNGQVVQIKYDPENPNKIRAVDGPDTAKSIYVTGGIVFGAGVLLNLFMNWQEKHRAEKKAERKLERKYKNK